MEAIPPSYVTAMGDATSFEFAGCLTLSEAQAQIIKASARIIDLKAPVFPLETGGVEALPVGADSLTGPANKNKRNLLL
ncbi:hypothetical protein V6N13_010712 [Hibiscus sabdariffa]|uniref:Uncharacterized protein n=1 Tax=Hibiscus sabdariffa TaxID=183260 RepID=A0ABR2SAA7_9ROSI